MINYLNPIVNYKRPVLNLNLKCDENKMTWCKKIDKYSMISDKIVSWVYQHRLAFKVEG